MYSFFAYIDRMKYINRWSLMRSTERENLMEHSAQVAIIAHALAVIGNTYFGKNYDEKSVAALALFHDTGEVITGDLPTPVKYYNPEIRDAYKAVGQLVYACTAAGKTLEELTLAELQAAHPLFEADVYEAIDLHTCVSQRNSYGGPSVAGTTKQLELINTFLKEREGV